MMKISDKINSKGQSITLQEKIDFENSIIGDLDGYDCPMCLNKGFINYERDGAIWAKRCSCVPLRKSLIQIQELEKKIPLIKTYSFDTFNQEEDWQKKIVKKAKENVGLQNWFVLTGITGCGKSHICTALFKEELKKGIRGKYFMWKDEIVRLKAFKKSTSTDNQLAYSKAIAELISTDLLYIDDFLKDMDKFKEDLDIAYQIINARYCSGKKTIISSELSKDEMAQIDMAIQGRIYERCAGFWVDTKKEKERNYRLKCTILS